MKKLLTTLLLLLTVTFLSAAVKIHICGDSMSSIYGDQSNDESATNTYNEGMRGWGQYFGDYTTLTVQDWAHTGTTAKGFYSSANYWKAAIGTTDQSSSGYQTYLLERPYVTGYTPIAAGDYVILIWGHNDQKGGSLHNGYRTLDESEYVTYLTKMVQEVKDKGAYPILGTSICRCLFNGTSLSYLGKIDACEAAGATHSDTDDPFDYPAAVRKLAASLNVPCLDLNAGSQSIWEECGKSISGSQFFPAGGTTHTSEKGAKAVCAYANNAIAAWNADNINGATLANYSDLISSMKSGITIPQKSDFASVETTVTEDMTWTFDKDKDGNAYTTKDTIATSLIDDNGLFLRATDTRTKGTLNRYISVYAGSNNIALGDKNVTTTMFTRNAAGNFSGIDADATAGMAISTTTCPLMAINTAGPGTLYVSMSPDKKTTTTGRYLKIMFNGADSSSVETANLEATPVTYKVHAKEGGHFFFGGTIAYRIYAVRYVPDTDTSEDAMHEPTGGDSGSSTTTTQKVYYVATDGSDSNAGTKEAPFATFGKAYAAAINPGDTVYFRGGTYTIQKSEMMVPFTDKTKWGYQNYSIIFNLKNSGSASGGHIVYAGYPGERPIFDFSNVTDTCRLQAFYIYGSYIHMKNFDIVGVQAPVTAKGENSQSECISVRRGSNCIFENLAIHDGMGIGYYQTAGSNNLVLNCDAYNIYDTNGMAGSGENSDGFGFHLGHTTDTGNKIKGCRAWWCVDDGYDCINSKAAVEFDGCWAFYNGFKPGSATGVGNGNGFKAGGYGSNVPCKGFPGTTEAPQAPQNYIHHCVAYYNRENGFYANHHLNGDKWENNTAMYNKSNFDMTNRDSTCLSTKYVNVPGYNHILINNVSYAPSGSSSSIPNNWTSIDSTACTLTNNVIAPKEDFLDATRLSSSNLAKIELCNARQADGSLPVVKFLTAKYGSSLYNNQQGALFEDMGDYITTNTFLKFLETKNFTEDYKDGKFTIHATGNTSYDCVKEGSATYTEGSESVTFTNYLYELCGDPWKSTSTTGRYLSFNVMSPCTVDLFISSTSTNERTVYVCDGTFSSSNKQTVGTISSTDVKKITYSHTGSDASQISVFASSTTKLYGIRVNFSTTDIKGVVENKSTNPQQQTVKTFVNGKLVIRKADGSLYNIAGTRL